MYILNIKSVFWNNFANITAGAVDSFGTVGIYIDSSIFHDNKFKAIDSHTTTWFLVINCTFKKNIG